MKWLLLVRHVESTKNIEGRFASATQSESLTPAGENVADLLGREVSTLRHYLAVSYVKVLSGSSSRAQLTASHIAYHVKTKVEVMEHLRSIRIEGISGRVEADLVRERNPFMLQLLLYRAGLRNSYDLPGMRAISKEFEIEQLSIVDSALAALPNKGMCVIVTHRSPITAILIGAARLGHDYPDDFYGFVPLELGSCSLVQVGSRLLDGSPPRIFAVNVTCSHLIQHCKE